MTGIYPNTFYRVAVKALIRNEEGKLLLVKEKSDKWDLPGGGLDHGEEPEDGIRRELREELGITNDIQIGSIVDLKSFWLEDKQAWLMWVVYQVTLPKDVELTPGEGVVAVGFIDPKLLQSSRDEREGYLSVYADESTGVKASVDK